MNIRFFKDPVVTILLIISLALSFFLVLNGLQMYQRVEAVISQQKDEQYAHTYMMSYTAPDEYEENEVENNIEEYIPYIECKSGNISVEGIGGTVGDGFDGYLLEILLTANESVKYKMDWGEISNEPYTVVIDRDIEKEAVKKEDGLYITIEGEWYKVTGVFASSSGYGSENHILLTYGGVGEKLKENIYKNFSSIGVSYNIIYKTDHEVDDEDLFLLEQWGNKWLDPELIIEEHVEDNTVSDMLMSSVEGNTLIFLEMLVLIAVINCILVADLWIKRRKKEFVIRKAFGENNLQIMKHLVLELGKLAFISCIFVLVLETAYYGLMGESFLDWNKFIWNMLSMLAAVCIVVIVTLILPMYKIMKLEPAKGIAEE